MKRSSLEFGNEAIRYESVMAEEMKRQGVVGNSSDYTQRYGAVHYITHHKSVYYYVRTYVQRDGMTEQYIFRIVQATLCFDLVQTVIYKLTSS